MEDMRKERGGSGMMGEMKMTYLHSTSLDHFIRLILMLQFSFFVWIPFVYQSLFRHPNVLRLHGYFSDEGRIFLILEFAGQGEMYKIMNKHGNFSEKNSAIVSVLGVFDPCSPVIIREGLKGRFHSSNQANLSTSTFSFHPSHSLAFFL